MRMACTAPMRLRVALWLEWGSVVFNLVAYLLLAASAIDWAQDFHPVEPACSVVVLRHHRKLMANESLVSSPALNSPFQNSTVDLIRLQKIFMQHLNLDNEYTWTHLVYWYTRHRLKCVVRSTLAQRALLLGCIGFAYVSFAAAMVFITANIVIKRGLPPEFSQDETAITVFFFAEFFLATAGFVSLVIVNWQAFLPLEERWLPDDGETVQIGVFLFQVSFNFAFFMSSSPTFRATLAALVKTGKNIIKPSAAEVLAVESISGAD